MNASEIQAVINNHPGLCVEIGGPTPEGYEFLDEVNITLPKNIIVTNISNPIVLNPYSSKSESYNVDAVVDVNRLPYDKGEISICMTSSLPHSLHSTLFKAVFEVLIPGGLLIVQNEIPEDSKLAHQVGFMSLLSQNISSKLHSQIYQKPGNPTVLRRA